MATAASTASTMRAWAASVYDDALASPVEVSSADHFLAIANARRSIERPRDRPTYQELALGWNTDALTCPS